MEQANENNIYTIGVDVGGTNTDVVLQKNKTIIACAKAPTSDDVSTGIMAGLDKVLQDSGCNPADISYVMMATTHMINGLLQRTVDKVAVVRLAEPGTHMAPPCFMMYNQELKNKLIAMTRVIDGGYNYNGSRMATLKSYQLDQLVADLKDQNINRVALAGTYSQLNSNEERFVAQYLQKKIPDLKVFLSHENDGGILEREHATAVNAGLDRHFNTVYQGLSEKLISKGLSSAKLMISQNDGTLQDPSTATPFTTLMSGPVNSLRGGAVLLNNKKKILVADIGGTTSDVGQTDDENPQEENKRFVVDGVAFQASIAQVESCALGGGTMIQVSRSQGISFGNSVANKLTTKSICFGGSKFTTSDLAILKGRMTLPNALNKEQLAQKIKRKVKHRLDEIDNALHKKLADAITERWAATKDKPETLVLVGGGALLFDKEKLKQYLPPELSTILVPEYAQSANAVGVANAPIAGIHRQVLSAKQYSHDEAFEHVTQIASAKAVQAGANPETIKVVKKDEMPIQFVASPASFFTVKVAGEKNISKELVKDRHLNSEILDYSVTLMEMSDEPPTPPKYLEDMKAPINVNETVEKELKKSVITKQLSTQEIYYRAKGCEKLSSGGGGVTLLSEAILKEQMQSGAKAKEIKVSDVPDDALIATVLMVGSPEVIIEKMPTAEAMLNAIFALQKKMGKKINCILPGEIGGFNGLITSILQAMLSKMDPNNNISVVDADAMGRAFPSLAHMMPAMNDVLHDYSGTFGTRSKVNILDAKTPEEFDDGFRQALGTSEGYCCACIYVMTGKQLKNKGCVPGTISLSQKLGKCTTIEEYNKFIQENPEVGYGEQHSIATGRIIDIEKTTKDNFFLGKLVIAGDDGNKYEVHYQNENLRVVRVSPNGGCLDVSLTPDIINIHDKEDYNRVYSTPECRIGNRVNIIASKAHPGLYEPKIMSIVGPQSPGYRISFENANTPNEKQTETDAIQRKKIVNPRKNNV